jgi:hypothetical protein
MRKTLLLLAVVCLVVTPLTAATKMERAHNDATRLASLLHDVQASSNVTMSDKMWRTIANEANTLANRIFASTSGATKTAARTARMHVREMRVFALRGDAAAARKHAGEAMPFVNTVINATAPK